MTGPGTGSRPGGKWKQMYKGNHGEEQVMEFLYPDWKKKALTFSYDDGQIYDRRLVEIFNKYGMKGTFHLNSGTVGRPEFVEAKELCSLYEGQEIACHGAEHRHVLQLSTSQQLREVWQDRADLEKMTGRIIRGMSYAFGEYSDEFIGIARAAGIRYSRTVRSTRNFGLPRNFMKWDPTMHHNEGILEKLEKFHNIPGYEKMPLFYVWGHSFEFERENTWDLIETFVREASGDPDTWYASNGEICEYVTALRNVEMSVGLDRIYNPAAVPVYYTSSGKNYVCRPGEERSTEG